MTEKQNTKLG